MRLRNAMVFEFVILFVFSVIVASAVFTGCSKKAKKTAPITIIEAPVVDKSGPAFGSAFDVKPADDLYAEVDRGDYFDLTSVIYFDFDSDKINQVQAQKIEQVIKWMLKNDSARVGLLGHTDQVGTDRYNHDLGMRRALSVGREMARFVSSGRISIESRGESEPVTGVKAEYWQNRRVVFYAN